MVQLKKKRLYSDLYSSAINLYDTYKSSRNINLNINLIVALRMGHSIKWGSRCSYQYTLSNEILETPEKNSYRRNRIGGRNCQYKN